MSSPLDLPDAQRQVFHALRRAGVASRAALAKSLGLSAPTVGKAAHALLHAGLLEESPSPQPPKPGMYSSPDSPAPAPGRPSIPLRVNASTPRFVAIQLGVRHTRLAALPLAGPLIREPWAVRFPTPNSVGLWRSRLEQAAPRLAIAEPWGVVVGLPGVVDETANRVLLSPNLHWTQAAPIASILSEIWRTPIRFVQEIRALALGHLASEPQGEDFLLTDFGAGVGAALVIRGGLYESPLPLSGELGHTVVWGCRRKCGCGAVGCVETLVNRAGLLRTLREQTRRRLTWSQLVRHVEAHGVEPWLGRSLDAVGRVIAGALNVTGVRRVVITGAPTEMPPAVIDRLAAAVDASAMWARFGQVRCEPAPRRWAAGLAVAMLSRPQTQVPHRRAG